MRKYIKNITEALRITKYSWKIYSILGFIFEYYKSDQAIKSDESLIKEYDRMDDRVEGGGFNFKFVSSLNFSCENLNLPRKSPNFLKYKNAKIIPQNNDDGCFQYALALSPGIACYTLM